MATFARFLSLPALFALFLTVSACGQSSESAEGAAEAADVATEAPEVAMDDSMTEPVNATEYLATNAAREEVTVTASGLQYEVLRQGDGPKPAATSAVTVHYEGTLLDGTVFDSSYARDEQISFPLNRVIAGWTEGLQLMPVGSKYRFVIPSNLAYGERGAGNVIGPNETLIFDVELFDIQN